MQSFTSYASHFMDPCRDSVSHSEYLVCLKRKILPCGVWFPFSSAIIYCIVWALEEIAEPVWII